MDPDYKKKDEVIVGENNKENNDKDDYKVLTHHTSSANYII